MSQRSVVQLVKHQVIHLAPSASVREAAQLMSENHIGALLVMDEGRLVGIWTELSGFCSYRLWSGCLGAVNRPGNAVV